MHSHYAFSMAIGAACAKNIPRRAVPGMVTAARDESRFRRNETAGMAGQLLGQYQSPNMDQIDRMLLEE